MTPSPTYETPEAGFKGFKKNWRNDLTAAFAVAMVALPLSMGVAQAAGLPPISGVISTVIGGLVTSLFRGGHVSINGPAAGLITVVAAAGMSLDDGSGKAIHYVLAAMVMSGVIQVIMGIFKLGKIGEVFPASVIRGVLAGIGIIIFGKQFHVALGVSVPTKSGWHALETIPYSIENLHPVITIIAVVSILILIIYPRIPGRFLHYIPAPMWVLIVALVLRFVLIESEVALLALFEEKFPSDSSFFIDLPDDILANLIYPDFSQIHTFKFWLAVISITLISTIGSLASAKAVDKLDPFDRKTNLNKDLIGLGMSTVVSSMLGGFPLSVVIVRSSVNISNNGRTSWSNFFHGLILLVFVLLLTPYIKLIPLAALAAILVFTGYKLASPMVFRQTARIGWEQMFYLLATLIATLMVNLLVGLFTGIAVKFLLQWAQSQMSLRDFLRLLGKSHIEGQQIENQYIISATGHLTFFNLLVLISMIEKAEKKNPEELIIDVSRASMIDHTVMEYLNEYKKAKEKAGMSVQVKGLENHIAFSKHPLASRLFPSAWQRPMTKRQSRLNEMARNNDWSYFREISWDASYLRTFHFFEIRPIEYKENVLSGVYKEQDVRWETADLTFEEGALLATEVYHSTVEVLYLPEGIRIPEFILEEEGRLDKVFDRVMKMAGYVDIDCYLFPGFSDKYLLEGKDEASIRKFFKPALITFLEENDVYHVESNGEALLIFRRLRLAKTEELLRMHEFGQAFVSRVLEAQKIL
jgi:MFS superfamily sulfate permease-like transporter